MAALQTLIVPPDPFDLTYDFANDRWVENAFVMIHRGEREQPPPATDPAPGRWHQAPKAPISNSARLAARSRHIAFAVAIVALCVSFTAIPASPVVGTVGCLFCLLLITLLVFLRTSTRLWADKRDVHLLEQPDDPDVCLVEVAIYRNGKSVGQDRGAVWFEGGRLLFSGHRTSFAIGGEDVLPASRRSRRLGLNAVPLRVRWGTARIEFKVLRYGVPDSPHEPRFVHRLGAFLAFTPLSRGPRQWPPLPP